MDLKLKIIRDEGKESGTVLVHKVVGNELKKIGEIKFSDEGDKKWLLMVLTEDHPNVAVLP
jgi:hypothetical protein